MHPLFARSFLRRKYVVAAFLLSALGACEREAPMAVALEVAPAIELNCFCVGGPLPAGTPLVVGGVVGQPVTISLAAIDRNGHTVPDVPISWSVIHNGGFTDIASSTTDTSGVASLTWTLDTIAMTDSLRASIPSGATMLVTATPQHGAAFAATKISGDSQTVALGEASEPFIVKLTDRYGNPISGLHVAWIVNGGGTLSAITTVTDTSGTTQATLSAASGTPGARQIVATYGVLRASTFTLMATTPTTQIRRIRVYTHPTP
jgi:hypothetical protein